MSKVSHRSPTEGEELDELDERRTSVGETRDETESMKSVVMSPANKGAHRNKHI